MKESCPYRRPQNEELGGKAQNTISQKRGHNWYIMLSKKKKRGSLMGEIITINTEKD